MWKDYMEVREQKHFKICLKIENDLNPAVEVLILKNFFIVGSYFICKLR